MTCPDCGFETKHLRCARNSGYLIGANIKLICRVCRRKQDGRAWRWFRLLQVLRLYR